MSGENSNPPAGANPPFSGGGGQPPFSNDDPDRTRLGGVGGAGVPLPEQVGAYRIIRLLGIGGMGAVYEAEQAKPKRIVALKVLKPGMVSPAMLRRFEMEAEVLGRLQHPGIAQVYEAGTADSGAGAGGGAGPQPFFAMELIRGKPLIQYADAHQLDLPQRLALFVRVCEAVHYAHQQGVIHRDLKPSNILVEESGQPKVLDFGIAKATGSDVQAVTLQTDVGQIIGTLEYMSPEQAAGDTKQVDTRSDIYALGVIGYELLSGKLPLDLKGQALIEAVRVIQQDEPSRLSILNRALKGDIETIVRKALEKEKERRYQSVSELAGDIRRYLSDEPIVARTPSMWYHASMFARRHKALVPALATGLVLLILGIICTSVIILFTYTRRADAHSQYAGDISFAYSSINRGDIGGARILLDSCPDALRNWEWRYLYRILNIYPNRGTRVMHSHGGAVTSTAWSPDGKRIASGSRDNIIEVWDTEKGGNAILALRVQVGTIVNSVAWSPNGKRIASANSVGTITVWDAENGGDVLLTLGGRTGEVNSVAWSPNGKWIASGNSDGTIKVWDAEKGGDALMTLRDGPMGGYPSGVRCVAWSPDGKWIASGGSDIKVWDAEKGGEAKKTFGRDLVPSWSAVSVVWSPDGTRIASANAFHAGYSYASVMELSGPATAATRRKIEMSCGICVFDTRKGGGQLLLPGYRPLGITSVAWGIDGKRIISGGSDGVSIWSDGSSIWDAGWAQGPLLALGTKQCMINSVACSPDGDRIVSGGDDGTITVWDASRDGYTPAD